MEDEKMETEVPSKDRKDSEEMETSSPKRVPCNKDFAERKKYDWNEVIKPHIKIAVFGEKGCGKSSLILAALDKIFPDPKEKFVSKRYYMQVELDGTKEDCMVSEIDDWEANAERREKLYTDEKVVALVCFNGKRALDELQKEWVPKLKDHDVPFIYVKIRKGEGSDREYDALPEDCMICHPHYEEDEQEKDETEKLKKKEEEKQKVLEVFREAVRKAKEA